MADHKEYWSTESDQGSIRISEDVVASIAALATSETAGVSGLYSTLTSDIVNFLSKKNLSKGVRVELGDEDTVKIEIGFLALFGSRVLRFCRWKWGQAHWSARPSTALPARRRAHAQCKGAAADRRKARAPIFSTGL